jgi:NADH-quinone oxidoreductase subunit M
MGLLSQITFLPIILGTIILFVKNDKVAKILSLVIMAYILYLSSMMFYDFDGNLHGIQFVESVPWVPQFNINYFVAVDGISMPFIILNNFITFVVLIASYKTIKIRQPFYNGLFLIMTGFINGTFCAMDIILFYIMFEAMLIPMYLIIGIWGGKDRVYAAFKFFLYTLFGSLLLLVAITYMHAQTHSFNIIDYAHGNLTLVAQIVLFIAFFFAFAIKVPMWPLHTWLPIVHPEAPTGGSMVLAAITLKIGGYGFLRFILPLLPDASRYFSTLMITLSLIAIVYIGFVALVQKDMKKLIAYSSVSHMGFVTLACFLFVKGADGTLSVDAVAISGAMAQMISHGFISAACFMCIGILYERVHSKLIEDYGGVVNKMPVFAFFFMIFAMANSGLPGTSGFVGEFMIMISTLKYNFIVPIFAGISLITGAAYTLWMYKRVVFGNVKHSVIASLSDITTDEFIVLFLLAFCVIAIGIYPNMILAKSMTSIHDLVIRTAITRL